MRKLFGLVVAAAVFVVAHGAEAQTNGTSTSGFRLVRAQCTTGPCNPFFSFKSGKGRLRTVKQPKPLTTRTMGSIQIKGISSAGPPVPASLDGVVNGQVAFGPDPDLDCAAANTITTQQIGTSSMPCTAVAGNTKCRGDFVLSAGFLEDPDCTDVTVTIQDISIEVYESGGVGTDEKRIAEAGSFALGSAPDCDSGGKGCP